MLRLTLSGNLRGSCNSWTSCYSNNSRILSTVPKPAKPEQKTDQNVETELLAPELQFLAKSVLSTYYFQKSLPKLPVPKLANTIDRYLASLTPILSKEELERTTNIAKEFETKTGIKLHEQLVEKNNGLKGTSYISGPWFEMYLRDRKSLPININPALVYVEDPEIEKLEMSRRQLVRSTNIIVSALRFMKSLDNETLEPEVYHMNLKKSDTLTYRRVMKFLPRSYATYGSYLFKAFPLDMSQFSSLFRSTRVPQKDIDILEKFDKSNHIVIMRRGRFYEVPVTNSAGQIFAPKEIMKRVNAIMNDDRPPESYPLGIMTTENRDTWAGIRKHLYSMSDANMNSFQKIDSAIFIMCLDDDVLGADPTRITRHFLHSDGTNRWFDKSFSVITTKDGWAGVNFEHAWGDGVAVMRFFNDVHCDTWNNQWTNNIVDQAIETPNEIVINVDATAKDAVMEAQRRYSEQCNNLEIHPFIYEKFGKKACKQWSISPDSVMQLGFQIAYYRMFKQTPATYESCSTSAFKHGRTETLRPATTLTKEISILMCKDWSSHLDELRKLIKKCSEKHGVLTKDAAMGQGFDRHLFALRTLAEKRGKGFEIFKDQSYSKINHNILSTSTLSSPAVRVGAFGPVVLDGFGVAYQIWDTGLGCIVTTYKGNQDGQAFVEHCQQAFSDLQAVMQSTDTRTA